MIANGWSSLAETTRLASKKLISFFKQTKLEANNNDQNNQIIWKTRLSIKHRLKFYIENATLPAWRYACTNENRISTGHVSEAVPDGTNQTGKGAICKAHFISFSISLSSPHNSFQSCSSYHLVPPGEAAVPRAGHWHPVCSSGLKRVQFADWVPPHHAGRLHRLPRDCLEAREEEKWGLSRERGRGRRAAAQVWPEKGRKRTWVWRLNSEHWLIESYYMWYKKLPTSTLFESMPFLIFESGL